MPVFDLTWENMWSWGSIRCWLTRTSPRLSLNLRLLAGHRILHVIPKPSNFHRQVRFFITISIFLRLKMFSGLFVFTKGRCRYVIPLPGSTCIGRAAACKKHWTIKQSPLASFLFVRVSLGAFFTTYEHERADNANISKTPFIFFWTRCCKNNRDLSVNGTLICLWILGITS